MMCFWSGDACCTSDTEEVASCCDPFKKTFPLGILLKSAFSLLFCDVKFSRDQKISFIVIMLYSLLYSAIQFPRIVPIL